MSEKKVSVEDKRRVLKLFASLPENVKIALCAGIQIGQMSSRDKEEDE